MMKAIKKTLALILAAILVFGMAPATIFAQDASDVTNGYYVFDGSGNATWQSGTKPSTNLPTGIVGLNKTATPVEGETNLYNITLTVDTTDYVYPSAVALCIDTSSSMVEKMNNTSLGYYTYKGFGNYKSDYSGLDTSKPDGYYCFESNLYSGSLRYNATTGKWEAHCDGLFTNGWTQLEGSKLDANFYISRKGAMIDAMYSFMSSYKSIAPDGLVTIVTFGKLPGENYDGAQVLLDWTTDSSAVLSAIMSVDAGDSTSGYGTPMTNGINVMASQLGSDVLTLIDKDNRFAVIFGDGDPDDASSAKSAANSLKSSGTVGKVFTVYSGTDTNAVMADIASDSAYSMSAADQAALNASFSSIFSTISGTVDSNLTVTDPMADYITVVSAPNEFVAIGNNTYTWDLADTTPTNDGKTYSLTYTVKINADSVSFDEDAYYPTNKPTYLSYKDGTYYFPVPGVKGEKTKYTVTFVNWDDSVISTAEYKYGTSASAVVVPEATRAADDQYSYFFKSWDKTIVDVTGNATYKATYTSAENKYTVTWKNEDGTVLEKQGYALNAVPVYTGSTPTKSATAETTYTFSGWDKEITPVKKDVTYTAKYTETTNKYTITWKNANGEILKTEELEYGKTPSYSGTPTMSDAQYNYTFTGWSPKVSKVTGNATYTAQYKQEVKTFTITWKDSNGTVLKTTNVEYGKTPTYDGTPTKAEDKYKTYTFAGWSPAVKAATSNATYTATYNSVEKEVTKYTITWKDADGKVLRTDTVEEGKTPSYGTAPTKAADDKYIYTFAGWSPEIKAASADVTYTATYKSTEKVTPTYKITWLNADGSTLKVDTVKEGESPRYVGIPSKAADKKYTYNFKGWTPDIVPATADTSYTAVFEAVEREIPKYTITWKNADGTVLKTEQVEEGKTPSYIGTPTKASDDTYNYTFAGWSPAVKSATANTTYTATYNSVKKETKDGDPKQYNITWLNEDGSTLRVDLVEEGKIPTYNGTPTKDADDNYTYVFAGWSPEVTQASADTTYKATFKAVEKEIKTYKIRWENEDGTVLLEDEVVEGNTPVYIGTPTKESDDENDYVFAGWSPNVAPADGDVTYVATFKAVAKDAKQYIVTWKNADGSTLLEEVLVEGTVPEYKGTPNMDSDDDYDYEFSGWSPSLDELSADVTYVAQYKKVAKIDNDATPRTSGWALLNLILTVLTVAAAVVLLVSKKKNEEAADQKDANAAQVKKADADKKEEPTEEEKKAKKLKITSIVVALISIATFFFTENLSMPMVFTDKFTVLMLLIAVVQGVVLYLSNKKKKNDDDDNSKHAKKKLAKA